MLQTLRRHLMTAALAAGVLLGVSQAPAPAEAAVPHVAAPQLAVPQVQTVQYYYGRPVPYAYGRGYYRPYPRYYARRYYAPPPRPFYRHYGRPHYYGRPYY